MESPAELSTIPPPQVTQGTLDLEAAATIESEQHHQQQAAAAALVAPPPLNNGGVGVTVIHNDAHHHINLDWPIMIIGFCFSWAVAIALQSFQTSAPLSLSVHLLCLAMAVAVAALFVSKYISPKFPNRAQVLEHVGVLFGLTAFFFAITVPCPLCLKLIYWTIYALALLVIFLCIRS